MREYEWTNTWFDATAKHIWEQLIPHLAPKRVLEIGSYEGRSACFLIDTLCQTQPLELHCLDTWEGGIEHAGQDMREVEARFLRNIAKAREAAEHPVVNRFHKGRSSDRLPYLLETYGAGYFDLVYIDGSHEAPDVLFDAVMAFELTRPGGTLIFDDYTWHETEPKDILRMPKLAIDAFININIRRLNLYATPITQMIIQKR